MNIEKLIRENYAIAKSKGFYPDDSKIEDHLMGIVSELGEAYEAHRGGNFSDWKEYDRIIEYYPQDEEHCKATYTQYISGTFEDEIADVFIRLFNLCGWLEIVPKKRKLTLTYGKVSISHQLLDINMRISNIKDSPDRFYHIELLLYVLTLFCDHHNIPIEKHIKAKMEYNKTRPHLHGKEY